MRGRDLAGLVEPVSRHAECNQRLAVAQGDGVEDCGDLPDDPGLPQHGDAIQDGGLVAA